MIIIPVFAAAVPWTPLEIAVAVACFLPLLLIGFSGDAIVRFVHRLAFPVQLLLPGTLVFAYLVIALTNGVFRPGWLAIYSSVPIVVSLLLSFAKRIDPEQRGAWPDYTVLLLLGLAVDLRWFEPAWPARVSAIGKIVLLDAGVYGFLIIRGLSGSGIDFRARWPDWKIGLRELLFYTPIVIPLGLVLGFLHLHWLMPPWWLPLAWVYTVLFIAIPEEIFFRAWMQNLLERRIGRSWALIATSIVFGLSHFNKRALHFNWRYVLLATIAGLFYGRAWREDRRAAASVITHASVDTIWGIWLR
jgi:membrane protease YdiL (CAAX protease family)